MIDWPKWILAITAGILGSIAYHHALKVNERRRPESHKGYICPRCRQGFNEYELFPVWQFPTVPLRLLGWNKATPCHEGEDHRVNELDALYCKRCRNTLNAFMVLSILITLPAVMALVFSACYLLGIIDV